MAEVEQRPSSPSMDKKKGGGAKPFVRLYEV